jgi:hypothetical protein
MSETAKSNANSQTYGVDPKKTGLKLSWEKGKIPVGKKRKGK